MTPYVPPGPSRTPHANQSSPELFAQLANQVIRLGATERTSGSPHNPEPHMASMKTALVANEEALLAIMDRTLMGIDGAPATGEGTAPHNTGNPALGGRSSGSLSSRPTANDRARKDAYRVIEPNLRTGRGAVIWLRKSWKDWLLGRVL